MLQDTLYASYMKGKPRGLLAGWYVKTAQFMPDLTFRLAVPEKLRDQVVSENHNEDISKLRKCYRD